MPSLSPAWPHQGQLHTINNMNKSYPNTCGCVGRSSTFERKGNHNEGRSSVVPYQRRMNNTGRNVFCYVYFLYVGNPKSLLLLVKFQHAIKSSLQYGRVSAFQTTLCLSRPYPILVLKTMRISKVIGYDNHEFFRS